MDDTRSKKHSIWPAVGAVAALIGAAGALIGGLAAAGVFDDDPPSTTALATPESHDQPTVATTEQPVATTPVPTARAAESARVSASLVYLQGATGCSPTVSLMLGDRTFVPTGLTFPLVNVPAGRQPYELVGTVLCTDGTGCEGSGSGTVDVTAGQTFELRWQEVALQVCDFSLL